MANHFNRLPAICRELTLAAIDCQHAGGDHLVCAVIFDHQHSEFSCLDHLAFRRRQRDRSRPIVCEQVTQCIAQLVKPQRLFNADFLLRFALFGRSGVTIKQQHAQSRPCRHCANATRQFLAVLIDHADVHHHQFVLRIVLHQSRHRFGAAGDRIAGNAGLHQALFQKAAHDPAFLNNQRAHAWPCQRIPYRVDGAAGAASDRKAEGAAQADLTEDMNFAAHQFHQMLADRQTKAGAAVFTGC